MFLNLDREAAVGSLKSGTFYNISVSTFCETPTKPQVDGERFLESEPATVSQVTGEGITVAALNV